MVDETMLFPNSINEFLEEFSFCDKEGHYTNQADLIPVFRVKQALNHYIPWLAQPQEEVEKEVNVVTRGAVLDKAKGIISADREKTYGSAYENFSKIAEYWTTYLKTRPYYELDATDVAQMMILLKLARSGHDTTYVDNYVDICGYAALAAECANYDIK